MPQGSRWEGPGCFEGSKRRENAKGRHDSRSGLTPARVPGDSQASSWCRTFGARCAVRGRAGRSVRSQRTQVRVRVERREGGPTWRPLEEVFKPARGSGPPGKDLIEARKEGAVLE